MTPLNPRVRDWRGCRVWLIGASSGIGAALGRHLLALGAHVALSARSANGLQSTAGNHRHAQIIPFDASEPAAWAEACQQVRQQWPDGPDWVVFCAAIYQPQRSWELEEHSTRATIATNLASVYYGLEQVLPSLLARGSGGLVLTASVAGYIGLPGATLYGPAKAALINLAELLYCDLQPRGLGVYLVNPGFVRTRLTARNSFPMPALQTPSEAARAILRGMAHGRFEIAFPWHFTRLMRLLQFLPYRWRFALLARTIKP